MRTFTIALSCAIALADLPTQKEDTLASKAASQGVSEAFDVASKGDLDAKVTLAVAAAAADAVKMADPSVPEHVVEKAKHEAAKTFTQLKSAHEDDVTASEQAAQVAVATFDAALPHHVPTDIVQAAEAASVMAGKAVRDHPKDQLLAENEAAYNVRHVVTAESVAAQAAGAAVVTAEQSPDTASKEEKEAIAASTAAIDAVQAVDHVASPSLAKKAETQAVSTFERLVEEKVPEEMAAKEASQIAVSTVDSRAPELLKQAGEAAAEAAVQAIDDHPDDVAKARTEAASQAAQIVYEDKTAAKAAVEAVSTVEQDPALKGNTKSQEASAAATAAVDAVESSQVLEEGVARKAESAGAEAFEEASDAKKPNNVAAEDAAEAVVNAVQQGSSKTLDNSVVETANAAAVAASKAVDEHSDNVALAVEEATIDAASDVELERIHAPAARHGTLAMLGALAIASFVGYRIYDTRTTVSPYKAAAMKEDDHENEPQSILLTNQGFQQFTDSREFDSVL